MSYRMPRLPVMTFCFPNEEEAEMRRTDGVSLWPWSLALKLVRNDARVVEYPLVNFGDRLPRLFVSDLWAIARCLRRPLECGLSIGRPAANCCCLHDRNRHITFFGDKILYLQSNFRKFGTIAMFRSLIRILCASLVQIDTKMAEKYAKQQQPAASARYAVTLHWKILWCMCVSINRSGGLDLWPFDLETGTRVASEVGNLHSEFGYARPLGSRVIRYVRGRRTDGQTDEQTKANFNCPLPSGGGITRVYEKLAFFDQYLAF